MADTERTEHPGEGLWSKLRRRNVVQWGLAYVAAGWGLLQGLGYVGSAFHWPDQLQRIAIILFVIGMPIALLVAWYHGDRGDQRVTAAELTVITLLLLLGGFVFWRYAHVIERSFVAIPSPADPRSGADTPGDVAADKSIAVLPFVNLSSDAEQEYFSDGVTEEILNLLADVDGLRVISRTSSFSFRGKQVDLPTIARKLAVAYVVEGTVRKAGDRVRVTAQLVDVSADAQLWSQTYERKLDDVFAIQSDVAGHIARSLKIAMGADELATLGRRPTRDIDAWQQFLQAREHVRNRKSPADLTEALAHVDAALARDPGFARAHSLRAVVLMLMPSWSRQAASLETESSRSIAPGDLQAQEAQWVEAQAAADRALRLEPKLGEPYLVRALYAQRQNRYGDAERDFRNAIARAPGNPDGHNWYGQFLLAAGYCAKGFAEVQRAAEIDPLSPIIAWLAAYAGLVVGRYDLIEKSSAKSRENGWTGWQAMAIPGGAALVRGDLDQSERIMLQALPQREREIRMSLAAVRHRKIDGPTRAMLAQLSPYGPPGLGRFAVETQAGDVDAALATIAGTVDPESLLAADGSGGPARPPRGEGPGTVLKADWWFPPAAAMRRDPRFARFVRDIGLVKFWREYGWPDLCTPVGDGVQCR